MLCLGILSSSTLHPVLASSSNDESDTVRLVRTFIGEERIEHLSRSNGVFADIGGARYFNSAVLLTVRLTEAEGTDLEIQVSKKGGKASSGRDIHLPEWDMRVPDWDIRLPSLKLPSLNGDMQLPDLGIGIPHWDIRLPSLKLRPFKLGWFRAKVSRVDQIDLPDSQGGKVKDREKEARPDSQGGKSIDKTKIDAPDKNGAKVLDARKIEAPKTIKSEASEIKIPEPEEPKRQEGQAQDEEKPKKPDKNDCKVIDAPSDAGKITKELVSKSETTAKYRITFSGKRGKNQTLCVFDRLHPDLDLEEWSCSEEVQFYADDSAGFWLLGWEIATEKLPKQIIIEYTVRLPEKIKNR